jgi:U2 small nuclear ribonucleoprotein A'
MKLTPEAVLSAPQCLNCVDDRELSLRALKAPAIESLAVARDGFDCVDLSDNEIARLGGFPTMRRLSTLLLSNNAIGKVAPNLAETCPNLHTIMLANNKLAHLGELLPLQALTKLRTLSLAGNPVTAAPQYRLYCIAAFPALKFLDFTRIRPPEREQAKATFPDEAALAKARERSARAAGTAAAPGAKAVMANGGGAGARRAPDAAQLTAVKAAIASAATLAEVGQLEEALAAGQVPAPMQTG